MDNQYNENQTVARIWFEVANLDRWDLEWEWMSQQANGRFLRREDVLAII